MKNISIIGFVLKVIFGLQKYLKELLTNNNCVKLEFINEKLNKETGILSFKLLIINNSKNQIRLERLYLKTTNEVKPVYIAIDSTNNPNEDLSKWIPFDNTYLMNKILYSVNSPGSRKIKEIGIFDNYIGMKNIATPIPKCKVDNLRNINKVEIVLEYLPTDKKDVDVKKISKYLTLLNNSEQLNFKS